MNNRRIILLVLLLVALFGAGRMLIPFTWSYLDYDCGVPLARAMGMKSVNNVAGLVETCATTGRTRTWQGVGLIVAAGVGALFVQNAKPGQGGSSGKTSG